MKYVLVLLFMIGPITAKSKGYLFAYNGETLNVTVNSSEAVQKYFNKISSSKYIPFSYLVDGCHVRTQEVVDLASVYGIDMAKIVIESRNKDDTIKYLIRETPYRAVWTYHMAGVVFVKMNKNEDAKLYVLDPSLFNMPVPRQVWIDEVLKDTAPEDLDKFDVYYISQNTFRPSLKDEHFTHLPKKLDLSLVGMLSQFTHDLRRYGPYMEKCIFTDDQGQKWNGGWILGLTDPKLAILPNCMP